MKELNQFLALVDLEIALLNLKVAQVERNVTPAEVLDLYRTSRILEII